MFQCWTSVPVNLLARNVVVVAGVIFVFARFCPQFALFRDLGFS
jgi:hypothetical protein